MSQLTVIGNTGGGRRVALSAIIAGAGKGAKTRFLEFFTVNIRNPNTRAAYHRAAVEFLDWCEARKIGGLDQVQAGSCSHLHRAARPPHVGTLGQAAPRLHPHAVRLAGDRPGGSC